MAITNEKLNELVKELKTFNGKKVEVNFENGSTDITTTYLNFIVKLEDELLLMYDCDSTSGDMLHILDINIIDIQDYEVQGRNINLRVFDIKLKSSKISLCLSDKLPSCCKCGKIFEDYLDTIWKVQGIGNYMSHFDGERLDLDLCDNCLYELLYGKDGDSCE